MLLPRLLLPVAPVQHAQQQYTQAPTALQGGSMALLILGEREQLMATLACKQAQKDRVIHLYLQLMADFCRLETTLRSTNTEE